MISEVVLDLSHSDSDTLVVHHDIHILCFQRGIDIADASMIIYYPPFECDVVFALSHHSDWGKNMF